MPQKQTKYLVAIIVFLTFLVGVSINCYAPAFPAIAKNLNAKVTYVQLIIPVYFFSYSIAFFCLGALSDYFGRRKLICTSLLIFIISCLWQACSSNITSLLIAHLIQGFAIAAPDVLSKIILSDKYSGKDLAKKLSYVTFAWIGSQILAPPLGAYIQSYFGWRYIFLFMALFGIFAFIIAKKYLPETKKNLLGWDFKKNVSIYKTILTSGTFLKLSLCRSLGYSTIIIFNTIGPFVVQQGMGKTIIAYGNMVFVFGLFSLLGALINRVMLSFISVVNTILYGSLIMITFAGLFLLTTIFYEVDYYALLLLLIPIFMTRSITTSNCIIPVLNKFPDYTGITNSLSGSFLIVTGTLISTITTFLNPSSLLQLAIIYFGIIFFASLSFWFYYIGDNCDKFET